MRVLLIAAFVYWRSNLATIMTTFAAAFTIFHSTHFPAILLSRMDGAAQVTAAISINLKKTNITPNAYWALFFQRRTRQRSFVWIDSICIDQENVQERNHQVALMGRIYSEAREVHVWLGLLDAKMCSWLRRLERDPSERRSPNDVHEALIPVLELEYWSRIWIVQELIFARKIVLCVGDQRFPWRHLQSLDSRFFKIVTELSPANSRAKASCRIIQKLLNQWARGYGGSICCLVHLLQEFEESQATDPRDKIFALLEIWNKHAVTRMIEPDYSLNGWELFLTVYSYIVETGHTEHLLHSDYDIPSSLTEKLGIAWSQTKSLASHLSVHDPPMIRLSNGHTFRAPAIQLPVLKPVYERLNEAAYKRWTAWRRSDIADDRTDIADDRIDIADDDTSCSPSGYDSDEPFFEDTDRPPDHFNGSHERCTRRGSSRGFILATEPIPLKQRDLNATLERLRDNFVDFERSEEGLKVANYN